MSAQSVLAVNDDLPIRTDQPVHSGKVRSVYWLNREDSARLISERDYPVAPEADLAVMVISDRLSAFDCIWHGHGGLAGVPGKGASLNAISGFWFDRFAEQGLARSHILERPHPLVWVVQRAKPIMIEAIARRYITGSMWRAYQEGDRTFCGLRLPEGLERDARLDELLITPSTKGVLQGIPGVPAVDDVNVERAALVNHWQSFGFAAAEDVDRYEGLLRDGFAVIESHLAKLGQLFVDTKFEFGYAANAQGELEMIYMDEVGTPDSSRIWDASAYARGDIVDSSKEGFRQALLTWVPDANLLLDKSRMAERTAFAEQTALPPEMMQALGEKYRDIAQQITGSPITIEENPREAVISVLADQFGLI
ncbi:MAG: phosphoribosylaminoimidazolesuccinocarboxamide synthase [Halieaceae bacterium]|jgi:phosphoribosylaminoimidazole-succinocarboxamide synthase|nr:phosphoribosylaminoimidazolesuccinocarboxamide synthase [Halieaceae bacterium]